MSPENQKVVKKDYKFIQLDFEGIPGYPVGADMVAATLVAKSMARAINTVLIEKDVTEVNLLVMGSSGAILGALVGAELINLDKHNTPIVCHFKKEGEYSHCRVPDHHTVDDNVFNVILDDFVSTGATLKKIHSNAEKHMHYLKDLPIHAIAITGELRGVDFEFDYLFSTKE